MWEKQVWLKDGVLQTYDSHWEPIGPAPEPVAVTGVSLNENSLSIAIDETSQLTATITPADATDKKVTWSSSDDAIATVSSNGLVRGVSDGNATITVTTHDGNFTDTCSVAVSSGQHEVQWVALTAFNPISGDDVYESQAISSDIQVNPYTASNVQVSVTSSDSSIVRAGEPYYYPEAQPGSVGYVQLEFLSPGTAYVTVTSLENPEASSTYGFRVHEKVSVQSISNISDNSFSAFARYTKQNALTFDYSPSNASIPSEDIYFVLKGGETDIGYGYVSNIVSGSASINFVGDDNAQVGDSAVYLLGVNGSQTPPEEITVTIAEAIESITLDQSSIEFFEDIGGTNRFTFLPATADISSLIVSSTGPNTAEASYITSGEGYIDLPSTGITGTGTVTIQSIDGQQLGTFDYEAIASIYVNSVSNLSESAVSLGLYDTTTVTVDCLPADANNSGNVYLGTSDDSIASAWNSGFNQGVLTFGIQGLGAGTATMTVYLNGQDTGLSLTVTVSEPAVAVQSLSNFSQTSNVDVVEGGIVSITADFLPSNTTDFSGITFYTDPDASYSGVVNASVGSPDPVTNKLPIVIEGVSAGEYGFDIDLNGDYVTEITGEVTSPL